MDGTLNPPPLLNGPAITFFWVSLNTPSSAVVSDMPPKRKKNKHKHSGRRQTKNLFVADMSAKF